MQNLLGRTRHASGLSASAGAATSDDSVNHQSSCNDQMHRPQAYPLHESQTDRLLLIQQETLRTLSNLHSAQEETAHALRNINEAIRELRCAMGTSLQESRQTRRASPHKSKMSDLDMSDSSDENDNDLDLERKEVRLDGLEVYAVVSAVTAGTLVAVFDSYHPGDIADLFIEGRYLEVLMTAVFLATGTIGIVCGLHSIFVFSLVTMYGRTALGMDRDEALEVFFANTGMQRIRGFKTFIGSLYALMVEIIVVVTSKVSSDPRMLLVVFGLMGRLMYLVYNDTEIIIEKAMVIFASSSSRKRTLMTARSSLKLLGELRAYDELKDENDDDYFDSLSTEQKLNKERDTINRSNSKASDGSGENVTTSRKRRSSLSRSAKLQIIKDFKADRRQKRSSLLQLVTMPIMGSIKNGDGSSDDS